MLSTLHMWILALSCGLAGTALGILFLAGAMALMV